MPHEEKIRRIDWEHKLDGGNNDQMMHSSIHREGNFLDFITERAHAVLNADDSSDESDSAGENQETDVEEEARRVTTKGSDVERETHDAGAQINAATERAGLHEKIKRADRSGADFVEMLQEQKHIPRIYVVDLTLDSTDEDEEAVSPVELNPRNTLAVSSQNTIPAAKDCNANIPPKPLKCNGKAIRIIDATRTAKPVSTGEQLPFLNGKLFFSKDKGCHQLVLRGVWGYRNAPNYSPQRFELISDISSPGVEFYGVIPSVCKFHGSFVYLVDTKGKHPISTVIEEKDVKIYFNKSESQPTLFSVKGSGVNKFGRFKLDGTAVKTKRNDELSYSFNSTKIYVENFSPAALHSIRPLHTTGWRRAVKRKLSDISDNSSTSDSIRSAKRSAKSGFSYFDNDRSSCSESPPVLTDEHSSGNFSDEVAANDKITCQDSVGKNTSQCEQPKKYCNTSSGRKRTDTAFDEVYWSDSFQNSNAELRVNLMPKSLLLSSHSQQLSSRDDKRYSNVLSEKIRNEWHEFGPLSGATAEDLNSCSHSPKGARQKSWTTKDVRPSFSKTTLDFYESEGIRFVSELLKADTRTLSSRLMAFDGFRLACALAAWKRKKGFLDVYKLSLAIQSIRKWKLVAETWWKKTFLSDWDSKQGLIAGFLSTQEASILESKFGIISAEQLLMSSHQSIIEELRHVVDFGAKKRSQKEVHCICEGIFYSWILRAREKSKNAAAYKFDSLPAFNFDEMKENISVSRKHNRQSNQVNGMTGFQEKSHIVVAKEFDSGQTINCHKVNQRVSHYTEDSANSLPVGSRSASSIHTPMSCLDFLFIRSQNFVSDEELSQIDVSILTGRYRSFLEKNFCKKSSLDASSTVNKWKLDASNVLGSGCRDKESVTQDYFPRTRIEKSPKNLAVMCNICNLCKTSNNGLPTRVIYCFDDTHDAIYQFRVHVEDSQVSPTSGKGAFLTYEGCKLLKESSFWKRKNTESIPALPVTRRPLIASFKGGKGTTTVTLKGTNIHGDEYFYGPENGVGMFNEYLYPDDFVDIDNITFSSKHAGCAMIELDRYAPLLPEDRKTDLVFGMKDFIFSHEPSAWRFDVKEELNGHKQVVDFTDDTTGSPHKVARSHVSMYVNEVGHDMRLVENVCPLETPRSVSYYIYIDEPMKKGDKVELLVNYGEHYEEMRERRGYGKSNSHGLKSDDHDFSRVRRNLRDRMQIEDSISSCFETDIHIALEFFTTRVWDGLIVSTSRMTPGATDLGTLRRQSIARRRLHWLSRRFHYRLLQLCQSDGASCKQPSNPCSKTSCSSSIFHVGMFVYVHNWMPKEDPRPVYSGIASILSMSKDKFNNLLFQVSIPGSHKTINNVPEGVVTLPVEEDFANLSSTVLRSWKKTVQEKALLKLRDQMLSKLDSSFNWEASFIRQTCPEVRGILVHDFRWEISEELLYLLDKYNRLSAPFDCAKWCLMSQSLLQKALHSIADFMLAEESSSKGSHDLCDTFLVLACEAANSLRETTTSHLQETSNQTISIHDLSFLVDSTHNNDARILIVKDIRSDKICIEDYMKKPQALDFEWYLYHQIVMVIHALASMIEWQRDNTDYVYSIQLLCDRVGLDRDSPHLTCSHLYNNWDPLVDIC